LKPAVTADLNRFPSKRQLAADLRGAAQLATQAVLGVTRITEGVHQSVWRTLGVPGGAGGDRTRGLTGTVYNGIRGATQLLGKGLDGALAGVAPLLEPLLDTTDSAQPESLRREALLAALNGVMGDRLAATGNPLATSMSLRWKGRALQEQVLPAALSPRVLLFIHGLCMNDLQWQPAPPAGGHVDALAATLHAEPIRLRYNSGQHISYNGRELSLQLERLLALWPTAIESISVVAHSMGGLVMRSALQQAQEGCMRWPQRLRHIVFLGTPHHGAPLERTGNWVGQLLRHTAYSAPFTRLVELRSAGITDLRHGLLLDSDWQGSGRFERRADTRTAVPLPTDVACFTVAATTAAQRSALTDRIVGDGLVPLHSALGQHDDAARCLDFADDTQHVCYGMNHMQLLHHAEVTAQMQRWLAAAPM
jgi:pimeloyl-ACP methyl ester carboxylesterase